MSTIIKKETFEKGLTLEERLDHLGSGTSASGSVPGFSAGAKIVSKGSHVIQEEAQKIIATAKKRALALQTEARQLLEEASERVDADRQAGYDAGYQEGLAEVTERLSAVSKFENNFLKTVEPEIMRLVYDTCEKVLGRELRENKDAIIGIVRQALRGLAGSNLLIRLNPDDYKTVKDREHDLLSVIEATATLVMKADDTVAAGGCVIESEIGTIDAKLATQLAAIKRALGVA